MTGNRRKQSKKSRRPHFPGHLFHLLKLVEENGWDHIISWVNDGKAFRVYEIEEFEKRLLPTYFNSKKYASFTRQLHAYGFNCVRTGRQTGIYSHPNFNRDDPVSSCSLEREVGRIKSNSRISKEKEIGAANTIVDMPLLMENSSTSESDSQGGDSSTQDSSTNSSTTTTSNNKLYNAFQNATTAVDQQNKHNMLNGFHAATQLLPFGMHNRGAGFWSLAAATGFANMNGIGGNHHHHHHQASLMLANLMGNTNRASGKISPPSTGQITPPKVVQDTGLHAADFDPTPFPPSHHGFNSKMVSLNQNRGNPN